MKQKEADSHSSIIYFFLHTSTVKSWIPKCSDNPMTLRQWSTTYQFSPLVKVLLLSSSFFSTASSSTAVCSKSADTESWGEQETSFKDTTHSNGKIPSPPGHNSPHQPSSGGRAVISTPTLLKQLITCTVHSQACVNPAPPSYAGSTACMQILAWEYCMPCTYTSEVCILTCSASLLQQSELSSGKKGKSSHIT